MPPARRASPLRAAADANIRPGAPHHALCRTSDEEDEKFKDRMIPKARKIMAPFVLRRLKADVLKQMPAKIARVIRCPLTQYQRAEYDALVDAYRQSKRESSLLKESEAAAAAAGTESDSKKPEKEAGGNANGLSNLFMQLRKMANHPLLHRWWVQAGRNDCFVWDGGGRGEREGEKRETEKRAKEERERRE